MGRYFKVVEITQAEFVNKVGDDVSGPWCQIVSPENDGCYLATRDDETEIVVEMDTMNQVWCDL